MEGARLDLFDFIEEHAEEEGGDSVEDQIRLEQEEIVEEVHEEEWRTPLLLRKSLRFTSCVLVQHLLSILSL